MKLWRVFWAKEIASAKAKRAGRNLVSSRKSQEVGLLQENERGNEWWEDEEVGERGKGQGMQCVCHNKKFRPYCKQEGKLGKDLDRTNNLTRPVKRVL